MKTKISSKNKNVINIKINTEKKDKSKRRKRVRRGGSSGGGGNSYHSGGGGFAMMPPIIIQPHQPMVFPQYNSPNGLINQPRETNQIISHHQQPTETYHLPIAEPIHNSPITSTPYINPMNITPIPFTQSVVRKINHTPDEPNKDFINDTSTHNVPIAKAIDEEADYFESFHTPMKMSNSSPHLDTIQNYYDNNDDDNEILYTNPMSSVKELKKVTAPEIEDEPEPTINLVEKRRKDRNNMALNRYHNKADDFSVEKYNALLTKWDSMNPDSKTDGDFANKKPSKSLYAKLVSKVNKAEKKQPIIRVVDEPIELAPVQIPINKPKRKVFVLKKS